MRTHSHTHHSPAPADLCQWSVWSTWTACADPCSGGVRQRFRRPLASPPGPNCRSQQTQSQSCNTGLCPGTRSCFHKAGWAGPAAAAAAAVTAPTCVSGERCEDRGRSYQDTCANQCPRSCTDLWEHVQCLQGACHAGQTQTQTGSKKKMKHLSSCLTLSGVSGCRCPEGQLLQDGRCVPVTECRCGIPSGNGTLEFIPQEELTVDCNTW